MTSSQHASKEPANLLWTGGWDSTFRLLDLLLVLRRRVATYYVISFERQAWGHEIRTMHRIRTLLQNRYPEAANLMEPTRFYMRSDFPPSREIMESYKRIRNRKFIGPQYRWLAQFASYVGGGSLELAIHRDDKAHDVLTSLVVEKQDEQGRGTGSWVLSSDCRGGPEHALFGQFVFPLFGTTKVEMAEVAADHGFAHILEATSFCHRPLANAQPCGTCAPCVFTMEEGLGRRLGSVGRTRYYIKKRCRELPLADGILGVFSAAQRKLLGTAAH